jgi:hypothetical protein
MDLFKNEETRVAEKVEAVVPQLEDIGQRGFQIGKELHECRNALKGSEASHRPLFGSDSSLDKVTLKLEQVRCELTVYSENSANLIRDITKILTEIRYKSSLHNH